MEVDALFDESCDESDYLQSYYYVDSQDITDCETHDSDSSSANSIIEATRLLFFSLLCSPPKESLMHSSDSFDSENSLKDSVDDATEESASVVSVTQRLPFDLGWNKRIDNQGTSLVCLRKTDSLGKGVTSFNDHADQDSLCVSTFIPPPPPPPLPAKLPQATIGQNKPSIILEEKSKADESSTSTNFEEVTVSEDDNTTFLGFLNYKSRKRHVGYG